MYEWANKTVKRMNMWDIKLIKWSVVAFVLFILSFLLIYPQVVNFIIKWRWLWFILFILFALKPLIKIFK